MNQLLKEDFNGAFEGVWIPKEIFYSSELSLREKFVLAEIDALSQNNYCFAKNKHFAKLCSGHRVPFGLEIHRRSVNLYIALVPICADRRRVLLGNRLFFSFCAKLFHSNRPIKE